MNIGINLWGEALQLFQAQIGEIAATLFAAANGVRYRFMSISKR